MEIESLKDNETNFCTGSTKLEDVDIHSRLDLKRLIETASCSNRAEKMNMLKQYKNQFKHLFLERKKGQKMTDSDAMWILNTFSRMRCDPLFFEYTDSKIMKKVSEWCSVGLQTVHKLMKEAGKSKDNRSGSNEARKLIPERLKDLVKKEIANCLVHGIPCTSKFLQDVLAFEGIEASRNTISRTLKRWNIPYGKLKALESRRKREYVLDNLKEKCFPNH